METLYKFKNNDVRVIPDTNGNIFFAGIDVATILNYDKPSAAILRNVAVNQRKLGLVLSNGQYRKAWLINEGGLYSLVLKSTKPEAKEFSNWVTDKVLPDIRKKGYFFNEKKNQLPKELSKLRDDVLKKEIDLKEKESECRLLRKEIQILQKSIIEVISEITQ